MADNKTQNLPPIWQKSTRPAIHLEVCRNGDENFRKRIVLNKKRQPTFDSWLRDLSSNMKLRTGSVWRVFTPTHGHRIEDYERLEDGNLIVVAGQEKFKPLRYGEIDPNHRKKSPTRDKNELPAEPNRRYQVSGRSKKLPIQGVMFKCCVNGRGQEGSRVVVLPPRRNHPDKVEEVINCVSVVMADKCGGPVDKLYLPTGVRVMDMNMISSNQLYVAVKCGDNFRPGPYSEFSQRGLSFSPKLERKRLPPLPYSNKTSSHSSPEHSMTSRNGSDINSYSERSQDRPFRRDRERDRERARRREEQLFNPPPARQRSKKQRYVDYDQDNGGVFKSKSQNRATRGAREVDDSRYTRVDLPVDQREAEPVHDEELDNHYAHNGWKDDADKAPAATQERDRTHRPNARRANSPSNEQANREKEREARERRQAEDRARAEKQRQQQEAMRRKKKEREEQKKKEEEEERKKKEEERKRKQEEERKRKEEERRRKEEEEEKRRRRKADERRKEQEKAVDPRTSTPDRSQEHNRADEEELAATKIQAGFRGARARQEVKAMRAEKDRNEDRYQSPSPIPLAGTESPHHHNHHDDHHQNNDAQQEEWAATKIQAGYRGYRERRDLKKSKEDEQEGGRYSRYEEPAPVQGEEDWGMVQEPDHNDRDEQERAAVKIQAGFRGAKARQEVKAMRDEKEVKEKQETTPPPSSPPRPASKDPSQTRTVSPIDDRRHTDADAAHNDDNDDADVSQLDAEHAAATKIQAAFRGQQTRKDLAQAQAAPAGEREDGAEGGEENRSRD